MKLLSKSLLFTAIFTCIGIINTYSLDTLPLDSSSLAHKHLYMSFDEAAMNPQDVFRLCSGGQSIDKFPDNIASFNYIHEINASQNNIRIIPDSICNLRFLMDLNLSANYLRGLPDCFSKLSNLRYLDLSLNPELDIEELIPLLSKLKNLQVLNLSFNDIKKISDKIRYLDFISEIDLSGNDISDKDKQLIESLLPNTKLYF